MASPQKEKGFTPIANEIVEALARQNLSPNEWQVLMAIFRKTYGWSKANDNISLSQFAILTGISKPNISRVVHKLMKRNMVIQTDNPMARNYKFNKDFDKWKGLSGQITGYQDRQRGVIRTDNKWLSAQITTKEIKTTMTKEITQATPSVADPVNQIFEVFYKTINPTINFGNSTQRKAIEDLFEKFGFEKTLEMAKYAVKIQGQKFSPTITTPYQLKMKIGDLAVYGKKQKANINQGKNYDN